MVVHPSPPWNYDAPRSQLPSCASRVERVSSYMWLSVVNVLIITVHSYAYLLQAYKRRFECIYVKEFKTLILNSSLVIGVLGVRQLHCPLALTAAL